VTNVLELPPLPPRAALRWDVVRRTVRDLAPATVLEIGCGQGAMGARLAAAVPSYTGVEPDHSSFEVARERIEAAGGVVLKGTHRLAPPGPYDLVCAFEVLEHLEDDACALADWAALVRPGGHLMLSVPAWPERFAPTDVRSGHFRRYSPQGLAELVTVAGFEVPRTTVYAWPLGYALEVVRNRTDERYLLQASRDGRPPDMAELTAASGRVRQPGRRAFGLAVEAATLPFALLQRFAPARGTGLVSLARRPYR